MDEVTTLMNAKDVINDFLSTEKVSEKSINTLSNALSIMHKKLYGKEKKVFVCDHTTAKKMVKSLDNHMGDVIVIDQKEDKTLDVTIEMKPPMPLVTLKEKEISMNKLPKKQQQIYNKLMRRKKMSPKRYILEKLVNNPMDTEELAHAYVKDGHGTSPKKLKGSFSTAISQLRSDDFPIVKIKAGRYGIRKEG